MKKYEKPILEITRIKQISEFCNETIYLLKLNKAYTQNKSKTKKTFRYKYQGSTFDVDKFFE